MPIAIRDLKRFATDHGTPGKRVIPLPRQVYLERVAIVGAGPTGLSAAYYLARRGYSVTVLDAMPVPVGIGYVSIALLAILGAIAAGYTLITGGRAEVQESAS